MVLVMTAAFFIEIVDREDTRPLERQPERRDEAAEGGVPMELKIALTSAHDRVHANGAGGSSALRGVVRRRHHDRHARRSVGAGGPPRSLRSPDGGAGSRKLRHVVSDVRAGHRRSVPDSEHVQLPGVQLRRNRVHVRRRRGLGLLPVAPCYRSATTAARGTVGVNGATKLRPDSAVRHPLVPNLRENAERMRRTVWRAIAGILAAVAVACAASGCHDEVCVCPGIFDGPGWCQTKRQPQVGCNKDCPLSVPCPGYCLPDGGGFSNPVHCDGGT